MNLETKSKFINLVIMNDNFNYKDINRIESYCHQYFLHYAFIIHDKDMNEGVLKHIHLHLVGIMNESKRFSTILNQFRDFFDLPNENACNIEKCLSLEGSIQYLIHKNDSDKYQYNVEDIKHNFGADLDTYLNMSAIELTYTKLRDIIIKAHSLLEVIQQLGLPRYNAYRRVINDMWTCIKLYKPLEHVNYEKQNKN